MIRTSKIHRRRSVLAVSDGNRAPSPYSCSRSPSSPLHHFKLVRPSVRSSISRLLFFFFFSKGKELAAHAATQPGDAEKSFWSGHFAGSRRHNESCSSFITAIYLLQHDRSVADFTHSFVFHFSPGQPACSTHDDDIFCPRRNAVYELVQRKQPILNTTRACLDVVTRTRWPVGSSLSVIRTNVLRDSCCPVTSYAAAVFTHHAGHSNRRLDTWTHRRREVQQQLRRSDRQILAQQMRSWWMTPPDHDPQAPQTTQVIMADLVARFSKLVRLHGASHKKVNQQEDPVRTPLRSKWSTSNYQQYWDLGLMGADWTLLFFCRYLYSCVIRYTVINNTRWV